jgi:tetratricopeptide (TPR) repeat protein
VLAAAGAAPARGRRRPGAAATAGLVALALLLVVSAAAPWAAGRILSSGDDALAAGHPQRALDRAHEARRLNPLTPAPLFLAAQAYSDMGLRARAYGAYVDATRLQPDNPATWRALALFLGQDPRAAAAWRRVHRLDPQDSEAALGAG